MSIYIARKNIKYGNSTWKLNNKFTCETFNSIYMIICKKDNCQLRYIGQSKRPLKFRLADHRGYISNKLTSKATGNHFNLPDHALSDLSVTIIEQVKLTEDNEKNTLLENLIHFIMVLTDRRHNGIGWEGLSVLLTLFLTSLLNIFGKIQTEFILPWL